MLNATPFPLPDRFWAKTQENSDGCLIWTAALNNKGYGCFSLAGTIHLAHRLSLLAATGEIPEGLHVDHLCRVRQCVNPEHLEAVTAKENNRRMVDALTTISGGHRRYPTVTHNEPSSGVFERSATHVDMAYMRARCPWCQDRAA